VLFLRAGKVFTSSKRIRLWDPPLRIFHWSLAALAGAAINTGKIGDNAVTWHGRIGKDLSDRLTGLHKVSVNLLLTLAAVYGGSRDWIPAATAAPQAAPNC